MGGEIEMDKSSRTYFHDDKHIDDLKACHYGDKAIASEHGLRVIADKGHPSLGWIRPPPTADWSLQQIFLDGSGRNMNSELYEEFVCYPSLSPRGIIPRHGQDQPPGLRGIFGLPIRRDFLRQNKLKPLGAIRYRHDFRLMRGSAAL
jgi:hypothetical protein